MSQRSEDASFIEVQHATVMANDRHLLRDISFSVDEGQHTAILGANGAGKSSLIDLLTYRRRPYTGGEREAVVRLFGRDRWNVFELRAQLGLVSAGLQEQFVHESGRVQGLEVVAAAFFSSRRFFPRHQVSGEVLNRSRGALRMMEVEHLAEKPIGQMSTGEVRRVLIARALAPDPRALLLDEPTTGLDLAARRRFAETLRAIARQDKTVVLTTHHLGEIFPEVEQIVLLRRGEVFRCGPKDEVLTGSHLSDCFGAPIDVARQEDGYYAARMAEAP